MRGAEEIHLATYGTLGPGRSNHHLLDGLRGDWRTGSVRGKLLEPGWDPASNFPGLILDPAGDEVELQLFRSTDLPDHWPRLDAFEGEDYRRVVTQVRTADGEVDAYIYVPVAKSL